MYRVVPFNASINMNSGADAAASQLEQLIVQMAQQGFEYLRMENIPTFVAGSSGCFGFGAVPATSRDFPVVIFRQR